MAPISTRTLTYPRHPEATLSGQGIEDFHWGYAYLAIFGLALAAIGFIYFHYKEEQISAALRRQFRREDPHPRAWYREYDRVEVAGYESVGSGDDGEGEEYLYSSAANDHGYQPGCAGSAYIGGAHPASNDTGRGYGEPDHGEITQPGPINNTSCPPPLARRPRREPILPPFGRGPRFSPRRGRRRGQGAAILSRAGYGTMDSGSVLPDTSRGRAYPVKRHPLGGIILNPVLDPSEVPPHPYLRVDDGSPSPSGAEGSRGFPPAKALNRSQCRARAANATLDLGPPPPTEEEEEEEEEEEMAEDADADADGREEEEEIDIPPIAVYPPPSCPKRNKKNWFNP
ncbi:hypothetical protein MKZ38_008271 [Zalerion maritima]|uniref:Uncharacterized protein n=1 Tax=Zalerion maritima TaxID=339359 RepID=A0AAD5WVN2_9PEZI|nr:hypothetical protein MKZ38_008271 [Zalerion maritima]